MWRLCIAQWADFAAEHKGTSYKLHVYVAWTTKDLTGERKDNSMSDLSAGGHSTCPFVATSHDVFAVQSGSQKRMGGGCAECGALHGFGMVQGQQ